MLDCSAIDSRNASNDKFATSNLISLGGWMDDKHNLILRSFRCLPRGMHFIGVRINDTFEYFLKSVRCLSREMHCIQILQFQMQFHSANGWMILGPLCSDLRFARAQMGAKHSPHFLHACTARIHACTATYPWTRKKDFRKK